MKKHFAIGMLVALICVGAMAAVNGVFANITASGFINSVTGYRYNGAAASNHILLGNGTNYVDATTLPTATLPTVGTPGTCTFPASVVVDAQGRVTSCTNGSLPKVLASVSFSTSGNALAPNGGQWVASAFQSWGTTLPNNTYQVNCSFQNDLSGAVATSTINFTWASKATTGFTWVLDGDHSGSNGFVTTMDCSAIE